MNSAAEASTASTSSTPSTSTSTICQVCEKTASKYTCPRCGTKVCSLNCTKQHKVDTNCDGVREKTEYVPMTEYNDVSMWRDLAFLREVGDKVKDWGGALNLPSQEAINRKERQLAGNRKGKQREDNGRPAVVHDRLKNLSKRELALRRSLMQNGIEILFLPKEMERHKVNKTSYNPQKKKLVLTTSVHIVDSSKKRVAMKIMHDNTLETKLQDIIKKAFPDADLTNRVVLLPVPVRPVVFSKNAPFPEAQKGRAPLVIPTPIPKVKPLPKAHSSLPMKPAWLADAAAGTAPSLPAREPTPEVEAPPKHEIPKSGPREAWLVDANHTLKDALKGTSILEWPEFEIWPEELARGDVEAERLEYAERRKVFDRDDWKRKRDLGEADEDEDEEGPDTKKINVHQDTHMGSDSSSDSDSSSSSSSSEDDSDSDEDATIDGETIPTAVSPPAAPAVVTPTLQGLRGIAGLPAKPQMVVTDNMT